MKLSTTSFISIERPYVWLLVALPLFVPSLVVPMSSDNSIYQSMAYDLLHLSKMPYLGSWDQNFPGIVAIHAIVLSLFGGSDIAFRIFDVAYQLAFCALLFNVLKRYGSSVFAGLAALLYALYYGRNDYMFLGQRELFAHGFMLLAVWLRHKQPSRVAFAGLFLGLAAITKPTVSVMLLPLLVALPLVVSLRQLAKLASFALVPAAAIALIYSFFPGGVEELYLATIRFNADVYGSGGASLWQFFALTRRNSFMYPLALIGIWMLWRDRSSNRVAIAFATALFLSVIIVMLQGKLLIYHYSTFFLLLCVLAAAPLEWLYQKLRLRPLYIGIACIVFVILLADRRPALKAYAENFGKIGALDSAYKATDAQSVSRPVDVDRVVAYLRSLPDARIEVISNHARLRDKLKPNSATRFTLAHPIGLYTGPTAAPIFTEYQRRWRAEFLDSLKSVRPEFIVLARNTPCFQLVDPWESVLVGLPGFVPWFTSQYHLDSTISNFEIYRRNS